MLRVYDRTLPEALRFSKGGSRRAAPDLEYAVCEQGAKCGKGEKRKLSVNRESKTGGAIGHND